MHAVATEGCIYNMYGFIYLFVYFFLVMNFQRQYLMQPFLNNVTSWKYQSQQSEAVCVCVCVSLFQNWKWNENTTGTVPEIQIKTHANGKKIIC